MDAKRQEEPINSASAEEGENEGHFLEVHTFEQGIKNKNMKGSRAFQSGELHEQDVGEGARKALSIWSA